MDKILLVSNPNHPGIRAVAEGYKRAFQYLGVEFHYFGFREEPVVSIDEANALLQWKLASQKFERIIFIQPSYFTMPTFLKCVALRDQGIKLYCINTDDPYSTSVIFQIHTAFEIKFTNEITIADSFGNMGFVYLPLAFDSLLPYKHAKEKDIDLCILLTFYKNRNIYLQAASQLKCVKFVAGNMAPLLLEPNPGILDISSFTGDPNLMARHKEYEIYSRSKFVLNPHRAATDVGKNHLNIIEGVPSEQIFNKASSPNPRFFDALGCGAIPLNDRSECEEIANKYNAGNFPLPPTNQIDIIDDYVKKYDSQCRWGPPNQTFLSNETYITRAMFVLQKMGYEYA